MRKMADPETLYKVSGDHPPCLEFKMAFQADPQVLQFLIGILLYIISISETLACWVILAGKWEWLSDAASLLPPCSDASSYYSQFGRSPGFTSVAGRRFKGLLEEHLELLRWPEGVKASEQSQKPA